jgi:hypothetical protein
MSLALCLIGTLMRRKVILTNRFLDTYSYSCYVRGLPLTNSCIPLNLCNTSNTLSANKLSVIDWNSSSFFVSFTSL